MLLALDSRELYKKTKKKNKKKNKKNKEKRRNESLYVSEVESAVSFRDLAFVSITGAIKSCCRQKRFKEKRGQRICCVFVDKTV